MKKLICLTLALFICLILIACNQTPQSTITPVTGEKMYENYLTLLQNAKGFVGATCPNSRAKLNGNIVVTQDVLNAVAAAFKAHELEPANALRVPGNSQELELVFDTESAISVYIYNLEPEQKALIWLQSPEQRLQLSADIELYNQIKSILDDAVVETEPSYDGEFIKAKLLTGRDIARGFAQSGNILIIAHSSYDGKGYVDFYDSLSAELLSSHRFEGPIYRLDTGTNGEIRLFSHGSLCYLNAKTFDIKSEYKVPINNLDIGDSFDVNEKLKLLAYIKNGTVYISTLKGEDSLAVLTTADVGRALPTKISSTLEIEEGIIMYKSPRFLQGALVATATTTLVSHPRVALSSFILDNDILEKLSDEEYVSMVENEFTSMHFPALFGTMGTYLGSHKATAVVSNDTGVSFSSMATGDGWQLSTAWGERIIMLPNGYVCTQTQELPQTGIRNRVDISRIDSYVNKTQVFASRATPLTVLGGTSNVLVMREGTAQWLLFVNLKPFMELAVSN